MLWAVTGREQRSTAWLRWPPLRGLGKICYGVYLLQRPVQVALGKVVDTLHIPFDRSTLWSMAVTMAVTFAVATLSWFAFERPLLRLKRKFGVVGHPQAMTAP